MHTPFSFNTSLESIRAELSADKSAYQTIKDCDDSVSDNYIEKADFGQYTNDAKYPRDHAVLQFQEIEKLSELKKINERYALNKRNQHLIKAADDLYNMFVAMHSA